MDENEARVVRLKYRYPRVFGSSNLEWGLQYKGGWDGLVDTMSRHIEALLSDSKGDFEVVQVKEKFGGPRFYYRFDGLHDITSSAIADTVRTAREASEHVCEVCGQPGTLLRGKLIKTRCGMCVSL